MTTSFDLRNIPTESLRRAMDLMKLDRVLYARYHEIELHIDRRIAVLEAEIKRRELLLDRQIAACFPPDTEDAAR